MGWTVQGSNPGWVRFSTPVQTGPGVHPASCTMGTGSFLGVKSGRGVMLTPRPVLVPWSRKSRAIPLPPLWAVRPVLPECLYKGALYRVSQEECARLREGVPYVKVYRYNPKYLCPKLNGYGDNGQRKVWSSCGSTHCTCQLTISSISVLECGVI